MSELLVLCYHAVSDDWDTSMAVTESQFEAHLTALADRGYRGATVTEAIERPGRGRTVAITFDDNFISVYERALPLLARAGFPATLYVPTDFPGEPRRPMSWPGIASWASTAWEAELRPASWAQLRELADAGWEIGSHTRSHPRLPTLGDDELGEELEGSRLAIEAALERACPSLAYPHGEHDQRVVGAVARAGYRTAVTVPTPYHAAKPLRWPRVGVHREDDLDVFLRKISRLRRVLRRDPLWSVARRLRP